VLLLTTLNDGFRRQFDGRHFAEVDETMDRSLAFYERPGDVIEFGQFRRPEIASEAGHQHSVLPVERHHKHIRSSKKLTLQF
jgi:hypothetical protein